MNENIAYLSEVMYQGETYHVVWIYESGLCEIKSADEEVKLVKLEDLQLLQATNIKRD